MLKRERISKDRSNAQVPRGEDLREGIQSNHSSICVHREEARRDVLLERVAKEQKARAHLGEVKEVVRIILHYEQIVLAGNRVDLAAAFERDAKTAGIASVGLKVEKLRTALVFGLERFERGGERCGN